MIEIVPLHGGQLRQISERFNIPSSQLIDFSANINPDGPPPAVLSNLRTSLEDISVLTAYPDLEQVGLKRSIAHYAGVHPKNIVAANGFIPLLESALRTLRVKRCLLPVPAFVEYRRSLARAGVEVEPHILTPDSNFRYDVHALVHGGHDAVLLANPQNPSGVLTTRNILFQFVSECADRNITVLLDEAFIDYAPLDSLTLDVERFANLIVFRSVTKFHGIPGLRLAYAVANKSIARALNEQLPPWPITTLASCAVISALADNPFAERTRLHNDGRRTRLNDDLDGLGIHTYPSAANFLLLRLPDGASAERLWKHMIAEHHMVLRDCSNYEALPCTHLRTAIRTEEENDKLVGALAHSLQFC
ncbi:MAG: pyridoxal phosphate-dependent aminotransferase [Acidobacteriaceae bacterium]